MRISTLITLFFLFIFFSCSKDSQIDGDTFYEDIYSNVLILDSISTDIDIDINGNGKAEKITEEIPEIKKTALVLKKTDSNVILNLLWIEPKINNQLLKYSINEVKKGDSSLSYEIVPVDFYGQELKKRINLLSYVNSGYHYTYKKPYRIDIKQQRVIVYSTQDFLENGRIVTLSIESYFKRQSTSKTLL